MFAYNEVALYKYIHCGTVLFYFVFICTFCGAAHVSTPHYRAGRRTGVGKTYVKHASRTIDTYTGQLNAINLGEKMVKLIYEGDDFKRMLMTDITALQ